MEDSKQVLVTKTMIVQYILIIAVQLWNYFFPDSPISPLLHSAIQGGGALATRLVTWRPAHLIPKP